MASQRFRLDVDTVSGGVVPASSVAYSATAGATAGFIDLFLDNADIKSVAMLQDMLEKISIRVVDIYRQSVGGV
jgi:hypothetical protein